MRAFLLLGLVGLAGCGGNGLNPLVRLQNSAANGLGVNFSYAKPANLGMLDPRATTAGTTYLWDMKANRLVAIAELDLDAGTISSPRTFTSNTLAGFGVEGLPISDVNVVESSLGGEFRTEVKDTVRQQYFGSKTALSRYIVNLKDKGSTTEDIFEVFRPKDQQYRVVIFTAEERSGDAIIRLGSTDLKGNGVAKFKVQIHGQEIISVSADSLSAASCGRPSEANRDDRPICFTEVTVYDPYVRDDGNIDWHEDVSYSQSALSTALRNL